MTRDECDVLVDFARRLATWAHAGQRYGSKSYYFHLHDVVRALPADASPLEECAAWLHDVVEDTAITVECLRALFPAYVCDIVEALTKPTTWERIAAAGPSAVAVKVADRVANVRACVASGDSRPAKYRREYSSMRAALEPVGGERLRERWRYLDEVLGQPWEST